MLTLQFYLWPSDPGTTLDTLRSARTGTPPFALKHTNKDLESTLSAGLIKKGFCLFVLENTRLLLFRFYWTFNGGTSNLEKWKKLSALSFELHQPPPAWREVGEEALTATPSSPGNPGNPFCPDTPCLENTHSRFSPSLQHNQNYKNLVTLPPDFLTGRSMSPPFIPQLPLSTSHQ